MESMKRLNITIDPAIVDKMHDAGIKNISGTIREALEDLLSDHKIILSVNPELKQKYHDILELTSATDQDLIPYIDEALTNFLEARMKDITSKMEKYRKVTKKSINRKKKS